VQHSGHQAGGPRSEVSSSVILQPAPITSLGATKPECNGLSQFNEDTGGLSVPVTEFGLAACLLSLAYMKTMHPGWTELLPSLYHRYHKGLVPSTVQQNAITVCSWICTILGMHLGGLTLNRLL